MTYWMNTLFHLTCFLIPLKRLLSKSERHANLEDKQLFKKRFVSMFCKWSCKTYIVCKWSPPPENDLKASDGEVGSEEVLTLLEYSHISIWVKYDAERFLEAMDYDYWLYFVLRWVWFFLPYMISLILSLSLSLFCISYLLVIRFV